MRLLAQLVTVRLLDLDSAVFGGFLDIGEDQVAVGSAHSFDLIEAGQGVLDMRGIGERLPALLGESKNAVRQLLAVPGVQVAVPGVGSPVFGAIIACILPNLRN
jgi:hypothetical protein